MLLPGDPGAFPDLAAAWITGLLDAALRGTLLLLAAGLAARLLREAPAAARHAVWASALVGLLATPLLQPLVPALEVSFVPEIRVPAGAAASAPTTPDAPAAPAAVPTGPSRAVETPEPGGAVPASAAEPSAPAGADGGGLAAVAETVSALGAGGVLGILWLIGFLAVAGTLVLGKLRVWWLARDAARVREGPWLELRDELTGRLGMDRPVRILRSPRPLVPMTWGLLRARVLLPAAADDWPRACKRNVLLHELAHVKRRDLLVQHLARLACALYWFHPLVWIAARRLRLEQEEACDDHVLRGGALASDYARHLVGLARVLKAVRSTARAGSTGHGRTDFARRMRALLSAGRERRPLSGRWLGFTVAGAAGLVVGLAALAPTGPASAGERTEEPELAALDAAGADPAGAGPATAGLELPSVRVDRRDPEPDTGAPPERRAGGEGASPAVESSGPSADLPAAADDRSRTAAADREADGPPEGSSAEEPAAEAPGPGEGAAADVASGVRPRTIGGPGTVGPPVAGRVAPSLAELWKPEPAAEAARRDPDAAAGSPADDPAPATSGYTAGGVAVEARRLVARLDTSPDSARRADLLRRTARDGGTRAMTVLMEVSFRALRQGDRVEAVRVLAREASREVGGRFLYQVARANPWPTVRAEAIQQLRRTRPDQVVPWLVNLAYHDEERAVQRRAVGALARLGDGGAATSLTQIARSHPDPDVRITAIYWLVRTGSDSALVSYVQAA